ncbi:Hypothetical protein D9617_15g043130 [Elsinoe fawcettii]|nr:Hypothetical protein D9617_15g043130 [Elsinoe fawcettii]
MAGDEVAQDRLRGRDANEEVAKKRNKNDKNDEFLAQLEGKNWVVDNNV